MKNENMKEVRAHRRHLQGQPEIRKKWICRELALT